MNRGPRCEGCGCWLSSTTAHDVCPGNPDICTVDGCDSTPKARGWCGKHYYRWSVHGDANHVPDRSARKTRRDSRRCGTRYAYQQGCRCFPCRLAEHEYGKQWASGDARRVPAEQVRSLILELVAAGWTRIEIEQDCKLANSTCSRILRTGPKAQKSVNRATAEAIAGLHRAAFGTGRLDARPLVALIRVTHQDRLATVMSDPDRTAFYRADRDGTVTERMADHLAITYLGIPLEAIYGQEAA